VGRPLYDLQVADISNLSIDLASLSFFNEKPQVIILQIIFKIIFLCLQHKYG